METKFIGIYFLFLKLTLTASLLHKVVVKLVYIIISYTFRLQIKGTHKHDTFKEVSYSDKIDAVENFLESIKKEYDALSRSRIDGKRKEDMIKVCWFNVYF